MRVCVCEMHLSAVRIEDMHHYARLDANPTHSEDFKRQQQLQIQKKYNNNSK